MVESSIQMWVIRLLVAGCACGAPLVRAAPAVPASEAGPFWLGADVSWVPQQERGGRRFSVDGAQQDVLAILRGHGFNMVRLRLFVDPAAPGGYSARGDCGLEPTLAMAARVKAAGMGLLLNFHYSDTWADPGHQKKPAAWRELPFGELDRAVESKVDFDLIGQSYYPRWHGTLADLKDNLHDLAGRYRRDIVVVEYSGPQSREVNEIVRGLPGGRGKGTFIWEPTDPKHGALFDDQGRALPALGWYPEIANAAGIRK